MKNLFIINQHSRAMFYGVGTYTRQLIAAFQSQSFRITVVTLSGDYSDLEVLEEEGVRSIHIPMPTYERYTRFFSQKEDDRFLRNVYYMLLPYIPEQEDLLFHFNFQELGILARLLKEHFTCRITTTMHYSHWSFDLLGDREKLRTFLAQESDDLPGKSIRDMFEMEQIFYRDIVDRVIAIARHNYDDLLNLYGVPASKVVLIPNGLKDEFRPVSQEEKQALRKQFYIQENEKLLLFVGRVTPVKGVRYLVRAFQELLKERDDIRLLIVGEGLEADFKEYLSLTYPFYSKISFTGFVPKEKLAAIYSLADIGIVPSVHEEFGYVAAEMLMYGVPLVVNETTGLKEIVQDGINGSYFHIRKEDEEASVSELKDKINELLNDPVQREHYKQAGRKIFRERYTLDVFNRRIQDFYLHIIKG